jgi:ribonuclease-3
MKSLMKSLGYIFQQPHLLEIALTHRSKDVNNNERFEFLGDAALGFIIAAKLFEQFPHKPEGELSRFRAHLVNEASLVEVAHTLNLSTHLRLGSGELKSGGMQRKSILADTLEAIIGAIYLDSDMNTCEKAILPWFEKKLNTLDKLETSKDAKSRLQEYLQSQKTPLPEYKIVSITGEAHTLHFHVSCHVDGLDYHSEGTGNSRRDAEQTAAKDFLDWLDNSAKFKK